jgi:hypothetical protein
MNRFFRSLDRALDAIVASGDVPTQRRLWAIRGLATGGVVYAIYLMPIGEWRDPMMVILLLGLLVVFLIASELRKLWMRVERLESEAKTHQASESQPAEPLFSN